MFTLSESEKLKFDVWLKDKNLDEFCGASGGRFTFKFTPTGLGVVVTVQDNLHLDELDLTDYPNF